MENIQNTQIDEEMEIDLVGMLKNLWRKMPIILLVAVLLGALGFSYGEFYIVPTYTSSTTMYVLYQEEGKDTTYQSMTAGTAVINDYSQIIKSRYVLNQVIENLGLKMSVGMLSSEISVTNPKDTRFVTLTVTDINPKNAQMIADEVRVVSSEHIKNVLNVAAVNVVDEAYLPVYPSSAGAGKYTVFGAMIGFILMVVVFSLKYIISDAVRTAEDIENKLGVSCLSVIPVNTSKGKSK